MAEEHRFTRWIAIVGEGNPAILELNVRFHVEAIMGQAVVP
jgi:hypothetical protein